MHILYVLTHIHCVFVLLWCFCMIIASIKSVYFISGINKELINEQLIFYIFIDDFPEVRTIDNDSSSNRCVFGGNNIFQFYDLVNELYRRNRRSIRKPGGSKNRVLIRELLRNTGQVVILVVWQAKISVNLYSVVPFKSLLCFLTINVDAELNSKRAKPSPCFAVNQCNAPFSFSQRETGLTGQFFFIFFIHI
jgi:hypothetical protein